MNILITGGAGFAASHLLPRLQQDKDVCVYAGVLDHRERDLLLRVRL